MPASKPFFRADHVGSLLRPRSVQDARAALRAGTLSAPDQRCIEDTAVAELVRHQEAAGLRAVTDGEVRRENWWLDFIRAIPGVSIESPVVANSFTIGSGAGHVPLNVAVRDRIQWRVPVLVDDFKALAACSRTMAKVTIPGPSRIHFHAGDAVADPAVYPDIGQFWDDVAAFYRAEIRALEQAGCRYIQIDDPVMSYFVDPDHRARIVQRGLDPDATLRLYVEVINACISERAPGTYLTVHICRGNARSSWAASGGYESIAPIVFPNLNVDALFLEYDDDRSGDFGPLEHLGGQKVVLGLLTSKKPALEPRAKLLARVEEAARVVPINRLGLSPQCGFASTEDGNLLTEADQWAKLALTVATAREIWGEIEA
ncbi:5-methyltetrahydropteroyltriglutamate--homocysteine S-methyltransferase [Breoghania sp. L-A4]|uniref:5-methyltetrahydropteroyltriglutamate-- homocysteine S-methyltransferase n=1 Tax=Breoghania sp. L-A4 TaxID=2304600 RepID=UPI000E360ACD|nr:5-methyltetrahydropteroyltriglutamate--homocysteine S-methyltransferase [Breoghania sp. L-A4]AXS42189.1 5-methyltetrahydropteroyltriglutamate--homocysteine S-methyltransferase [Breoghania sp. L-A4]